MKLTNNTKIGLSMAVFLATDSYDYDPRPNAISATRLLKSPRQVILSSRAETKDMSIDISDLVASSFGSSIHDSIERCWEQRRYIPALMKLGYSEKTIQRIRVNPTPEDLKSVPDIIPVYIEQRAEKPLDGFVVVGKFDFVGDGELEDHKTTGVYAYMKNSNNEKYKIQGSIYRWLNPDIITSDRMLVNYTFTDWSKLRSKIEINKGYPPHRMMTVPIALMSLKETEQWISGQLRVIAANLKKDEQDLPPCTKEELWQDPTVYKYYKNPASKDRSTKNFDSFAEAQTRLLKDGSTGCIDIVKGMAKACNYCAAINICSQAQQLIADGLLEI
jgi:hypothetical protein